MAKEYVLAIDQGTTSSRAMLFKHDGTSAGVAQEEHEQIYPQAGWVEHDPMEIWEKTQRVTSQVLRDNSLTAGASDYVTKPVDVEQLLSVIRSWLS